MDVGSLIQLSCARSCPSSSAEWLLSDRITELLKQALLTSSGQRQMGRVGGDVEESKTLQYEHNQNGDSFPANFLEKAQEMSVINKKNWLGELA